MIKVKVTKNIIRHTNTTLGIGIKEIIVGTVACLCGLLMYFVLKNIMSTGALMTVIFIVLAAIICFGCVNMQGQSLFTLLIKSLKGVDVRPYESKGVFSNSGNSHGNADRKRK